MRGWLHVPPSRLGLAAALLVAGPVLADNDSGLYIGASVGQYNIELDGLDDGTGTIVDFDSDDTAFKLFGGWRFNRYFALELAYIDLGEAGEQVSGVPLDIAIDGFAPYLVGTLPLGAGITVFDHLNLRLEYEILDIGDTDESNALWLTGAWRF